MASTVCRTVDLTVVSTASDIRLATSSRTSGIRVVPLSPTAVAALRGRHLAQVVDRLAWGSDWLGQDRVFTREDGTEVPGQWTSTRFEILAYRAGVPRCASTTCDTAQ